jgi:fucose permease
VTPRAPRLLIALAFVAFVSLGLPDCVLGVAWPSLRATFAQPLSRVGVILAAGTAGYLVAGFFGGQIVRAAGVGKLLLGSSLLVTISLASYAFAPAWPVIILAALVGGLGAGAIDTGINTFAAAHFSPRVVNWLHASWGIGATTGPLLMTAVLATHHGWRLGYTILAAVMLLLSTLFLATLRMWEDGPRTAPADDANPTATLADALRQPVVWLQALLFFLYAGLESTAGQLLFTLFTESRGQRVTVAGTAVAAYWAALTLGRIVFGQLAASLSRRAVLRTGMALAPVAAALIAWPAAPAALSFAAAALLGFALAPVFPTMISATPDRVGPRLAPHAVGLQVAAASLGIATLPWLVALLARQTTLEILGPCLLLASLTLLALHELTLRLTIPSKDSVPAIPTPLADRAL